MRSDNSKLPRVLLIVAVVAGLAAVAAAVPLFAVPAVKKWLRPAEDETAARSSGTKVELVPGRPDTLRLPEDVARTLQVQTVTARKADLPRQLELSGWLALDTTRLARVHARFGGELVRIEEIDEVRPGQPTEQRSLRPGDRVAKGQLLAVVWSKDLGEKKSELVDALSQLRLDRERLASLEIAWKQGGISEATYRQGRRNVEAGEVAAAKAERTLRSWRLSEEEIAAVKAEAERLRPGQKKRDRSYEKEWARVEVVAPFAGTILERNVATGDIVDTTTDLFKIADLRHLTAWVNIFEEDLPALLDLPPDRKRWTIRLKADPDAPAVSGPIDYIGDIIDPNQHTALVQGRVPNPEGRLRVGQFITATVELPLRHDEVAVPVAALLEDGTQSVVFVADKEGRQFTLRRVTVARRSQDAVFLRSGVAPNERVVSEGALVLKAALDDLKASSK
jgi:cobalt-zinc-cadmium efflux system membrane fusion protein